MSIPENQLITWSHQGSIVQSAETYRLVREALTDQRAPYAGRNYRVFLQGSYGNDTNVWRESDVDIVIELIDCWHCDLSELSPNARERYAAAFIDASYGYAEFKHEVTRVLTDRFGAAARPGAKAISIEGHGNRRKVDVIVAVQYRRYFAFDTSQQQDFAEGICFWNSQGQQIVNYPRQHAQNLTAKHQATGNRLKPLIRVFKNLRTAMVEDGELAEGQAPSYFLEGLIYNLPDEFIAASFQQQTLATLAWVRSHPDGSDLICPNAQYYLVRDDALTCWSFAGYRAFAAALAVRLV